MIRRMHFGHSEHQRCTEWCYDRLVERPGSTIIHDHDEGDSCDPVGCTYGPSFFRALSHRLVDRLRRLVQ